MEDSLFNDFSGSEHMVVEHNILFSVGGVTGESALSLMDMGMVPGLTTGGPVSTVGAGVNLTLLPFDFSTDFSTEGRLLGDDSMTLTSLNSSTDDPQVAMGLAVFSTIAVTTGGGGGYIIIVPLSNDQPNSCVEKNAATVYNSLHGAKGQTYQFPAVITESPSGHKTAAKVFGKGSLDRTMEALDVWESLLQEHVSN